MKKIRYILYFSNNELFLLDKKKNNVVSDFFLSVKNDEIIDEKEFIKEFNNFLKKNKILISLFGDNITIITNYEYTNFYKNNLKNIFSEYFKSINFINIIEILNISSKTAYLNITTNYLDYYYYKGEKRHLRIPLTIFNNNITKIYNHFINTIFRPKKIYIFGNNSEIPKINDKLSKEQAILVMFIENYSEYVVKLFGL